MVFKLLANQSQIVAQFENDVKMYGIQTGGIKDDGRISLRMM